MAYINRLIIPKMLLLCAILVTIASCDSNDESELVQELEEENEVLLRTIKWREELSNQTYFLIRQVDSHERIIQSIKNVSMFNFKDTSLINDYLEHLSWYTNNILEASNSIMSTNIDILEAGHKRGKYAGCTPQLLFFHLIKNQRTNQMAYIAFGSGDLPGISSEFYVNFIYDSLAISQLEEYSRFVELQTRQKKAYEKYLELNECDSINFEYYKKSFVKIHEFQRDKERDERSDSLSRVYHERPMRFNDYVYSHSDLFNIGRD